MPKHTRTEEFRPPERQLTDQERSVLPYSNEEITEMTPDLWPPATVKRHAMKVFNCSESMFYKAYSHRFTYRAYSERIQYNDDGKEIVPADYKIPVGAALKRMARILLNFPKKDRRFRT